MKLPLTVMSLWACLVVTTLSTPALNATNHAPESGSTLTPTGAERAGDPAHGIPEWTGGWRDQASEVDAQLLANEAPLALISAANRGKYADILTPGQAMMLERFPGTWSMAVYPSRRTAALPDAVYDALEGNRQSASLRQANRIIDGVSLSRSRVADAQMASPFPEPKTGLEAVWNHLLRWRGVLVEAHLTDVAVTTDGRYTPFIRQAVIAAPYSHDPAEGAKQLEGLRLAYIGKLVSPSVVSQSATLIHTPLDYINHSPRRWDYLARARRVISTPPYKGEQPIIGSDGLRFYDQFEMYNGTPDIYDWTLVGKRVALIPYNAQRLTNAIKSSHRDLGNLIGKDHIAPELARYEHHRVWVVEGVLKDKAKHVLERRTFYLDEDTWQIVLAEGYDKNGKLVSFSENHTRYYPEGQTTWMVLQAFYRFDRNRYLASFLDERLSDIRFSEELNPILFSPNHLHTIAQ